MQGRNCKFSGPDCPFSHGVEAPLCDLLPASNSVAEEEDWLASIYAGSRLLARYHDRVWYEATAEERLPATPSTGDRRGFLAVRFKGFEEDGPVTVAADASHLAPLETLGGANAGGMEGGNAAQTDDGQGGGSGGGGSCGAASGSEEEDSDLEDAWADAPRVFDAGNVNANNDDDDDAGFFQERVLGDRHHDGGGGGLGVKREGAGAEGGLCSDVYVFGDWEQHTKGFGSRMMSRMGYRRGEGLGREKQVSYGCAPGWWAAC